MLFSDAKKAMLAGTFLDPRIRQKRNHMIARARDIADRYHRVRESKFAVTLDNF